MFNHPSCHRHPRGSVCAGHFSGAELHPPNCNFVGHHSPVTPALFPPPTSSRYIMLTTPLAPSSLRGSARSAELDPRCSLSSATPAFVRAWPGAKGEKPRRRSSRTERRRSLCVTRVCERASISGCHWDRSSFGRCLCSRGTSRRKGN